MYVCNNIQSDSEYIQYDKYIRTATIPYNVYMFRYVWET